MQEGIEQQNVLFRNRARSIFFSHYEAFRHSIASIDRQGDENVFQQLQNRFANQLHQRLHTLALEILDQVEPGHRTNLHYSLSRSIEEFVREFMQKAKSL